MWMRLSHDLPCRTSRLLFAVLLVLIWSGGDPRKRAAAADPAAPTAADLRRLADATEKLFAAIDEAAKGLPRDRFDTQPVIDQARGDPAALFAWVRDNTHLVPYRGVLRDFQGVLLDRLGNSLDRSLLLLTLLRRAGHKQVRLAFSELSEERAAALLEGLRPPPPEGTVAGPAPGPEELNAFIEAQAKRDGSDAARARETVSHARLRAERLHEEAAQRTAEQTADLLDLIGERSPAPPPAEEAARLRAGAVRALRQHWWVQWHDGRDWVDLDAAPPDARPARAQALATRTLAPEMIDEGLKDEAHRVVVRVVIERWNRGKLEEGTVLTQPLLPCAFIGQRVALYHAPMNWPDDASPSRATDPAEKLKSLALAETEWMPVISVESDRAASNVFTAEGRIYKHKALPPFVKNVLAAHKFAGGFEQGAEAAGKGVGSILRGGGIGDRAGRAPTGPQQPEPRISRDVPRDSALTAEWIEYEIQSPGGETRTVRRETFDLLGPAARAGAKGGSNVPAPSLTERKRLERGLALLGETEILLQVCQFPPEFVAHLALKKSLANRQALPGLLRRAAATDPGGAAESNAQLAQFGGHLYAFAMARQRWANAPGKTYLDRVNVVNLHKTPHLGADGSLRTWLGLDIVANDVAVHPKSGGDPFRIRVERGVLDTNAEALVLAPSGGSGNTAELFGARGAGVPWVASADAAGFDAAAGDAPADLRARVRLDLDAGSVIVAPQKPTPSNGAHRWGWWRIDPATGTTLGMGESGWGQTTTERVLMVGGAVWIVLGVYECLSDYSQTTSTTARVLCIASAICMALPFVLAILMFAGLFWIMPVLALVAGPVFTVAAAWGAPAQAAVFLFVCDGLNALSGPANRLGLP